MNLHLMKNAIIVFFLILTFGTSMSAQVATISQIDGVYMVITNKYAPDKRTAILDLKFDVDIEKNLLTVTGETNVPAALDEMRQMLYNYTIKDLVERLPSKSLNGYEFGVVTLSVANIRLKPFHPAELVTQALMGTPVTVLKEGEDNWFLVQTPEGYIGWVDDAGIQTFTKKEMDSWYKDDKLIFTDVYGFVYAEENEKGGTISDITAGGILQLKSSTKNGYKVALPDGREGYISKKSATPLKKWIKGLNPDPNDIIKTAKKFLGVPYLWGGTSPKGMDCSGFTKTVYFLNGILLARDASQQCLYGEEVDVSGGYDKLKRGDLLFFGPKPQEGKPQRITHVGIYMGNKEFIHAAGMVRINSFDSQSPIFSAYRTGMLVSARRILTKLDSPGILKLSIKNYIK